MSPFGTISCVHRAEVEIPEDVWQRFGHTEEYKQASYAAHKGLSGSGGQDRYAGVIEWFEGPTRNACEVFINRWHNRILQWQHKLREEPECES